MRCRIRPVPHRSGRLIVSREIYLRFGENIRVDYTVKPEVDLESVKADIYEFVAGIRSHHPERRYTSFQHPADPNSRGDGRLNLGESIQRLAGTKRGTGLGIQVAWKEKKCK